MGQIQPISEPETRVLDSVSVVNAPLDIDADEEEVLTAIDECCGIKTLVCMRLRCNYSALQRYCEKHPRSRIELKKAKERIVNLAEEVVVDSLASKKEEMRLKAAEMVLRMLGSQFGWKKVGSNQKAVAVSVENEGGDDKKVRIQAIFGVSDQGGQEA